MKYFLFLLTFLSLIYPINAQDTLFHAKHVFDSPVRNVFEANGEVYAKTGDKLYKFTEEGWDDQKITFNKPYVFFNEKFYESDFIPNSELFNIRKMKELIPLKGEFIATSAKKGNRFFLSVGNALFEYEIRSHYSKSYHTQSIRDIYLEDSLKVISTYSGIYVNDTLRLPEPGFSNGPLTKIGERYFLPWDKLAEFFPPDSIRDIPQGSSPFSGKARKIILWNGNLFAMNTISVSRVDNDFNYFPIHQGEEYLDMEAYGSEGILISTASGTCFFWDGDDIYPVAQASTKIRDIYITGRRIYYASDNGVYIQDDLKPESFRMVYTIPYSVALQVDDLGNLWIASENGLYVVDEEFDKEPILVIPQVEFNRDAILLETGILWAGAVDGLYSINVYEIKKEFLPRLVSKISFLGLSQNVLILISTGMILFGIGLVWWVLRKRQTEEVILNPAKKEITIGDFEKAIKENNLTTVDSIADHFETNTVQLNRVFKNFETTPGKFLKKVKLEFAKEMLSKGIEIEEVSKKVGYSPSYIKKELNL